MIDITHYGFTPLWYLGRIMNKLIVKNKLKSHFFDYRRNRNWRNLFTPLKNIMWNKVTAWFRRDCPEIVPRWFIFPGFALRFSLCNSVICFSDKDMPLINLPKRCRQVCFSAMTLQNKRTTFRNWFFHFNQKKEIRCRSLEINFLSEFETKA